MAFTVADALNTDALRKAAPRLVNGDVSRPIRWAHSSEIAEIAPLMHGGEMLFTTGLGLAGANASDVRRYARGLVDSDVAAVVVELGRTFDRLPAALVEEMGRGGLPLIELHEVMPFVDIIEEINGRILTARLDHLHQADMISQLMGEQILAGRGLAAIMEQLTSTLGIPACLYSDDGHVICKSADWLPTDDNQLAGYPVELRGASLGTLSFDCEASEQIDAVGSRAALAFGLELIRQNVRFPNVGLAGTGLIRDLCSGILVGSNELRFRAKEAGFTPRGDEQILTAVITNGRQGSASAVIDAAAVHGHRCIAADVDHRIAFALLLPSMPTSASTIVPLLDELLGAASTDAGSMIYADRLGILKELPGTLSSLVDSVWILDEFGVGQRIVHRRELSLYRLLEKIDEPALLADTIATHIGPIADSPALLETLEAFLHTGGNKVSSAAVLSIHRQTMYSRLARIENLLGYRLEPASFPTIAIALAARRMSLR